jgi:hypothetical protein
LRLRGGCLCAEGSGLIAKLAVDNATDDLAFCA